MKTLILSNTDKVALVDDDTIEKALKHGTWYYNSGYACCHSSKYLKTIRLQHVVLGTSYTKDIDHINGDKLDCQASNLRFVTRAQNMVNIPKRTSKASSKYKGVCWDKQYNKWRAIIGWNGTTVFGGLFINEDDAGKKANELYLKFHGEFAVLNVIPQQTQQVMAQP